MNIAFNMTHCGLANNGGTKVEYVSICILFSH